MFAHSLAFLIKSTHALRNGVKTSGRFCCWKAQKSIDFTTKKRIFPPNFFRTKSNANNQSANLFPETEIADEVDSLRPTMPSPPLAWPFMAASVELVGGTIAVGLRPGDGPRAAD